MAFQREGGSELTTPRFKALEHSSQDIASCQATTRVPFQDKDLFPGMGFLL